MAIESVAAGDTEDGIGCNRCATFCASASGRELVVGRSVGGPCGRVLGVEWFEYVITPDVVWFILGQIVLTGRVVLDSVVRLVVFGGGVIVLGSEFGFWLGDSGRLGAAGTFHESAGEFGRHTDFFVACCAMEFDHGVLLSISRHIAR